MNTTLNIGLAGLGTVGGGLVRLLSENAEEIRARSGCDFNLKAVAVRNPNRKRDLPEGVRLTTDPMTLADDPDIDVVIELMGGIDSSRAASQRANRSSPPTRPCSRKKAKACSGWPTKRAPLFSMKPAWRAASPSSRR